MKIRHCFSLIELLIVVGILGALSALILPAFHSTSDEAKKTVALTQMKEIQRAFSRFHADLLSKLRKKESDTNPYLEDIARYGIWPLLVHRHPHLPEGDDWGTNVFKSYPAYNSETGFGWRGPYLEYSGIVRIAETNLLYNYTGTGDVRTVTQNGGQTQGDLAGIPVMKDPYGGYYRILCPEARTADGSNLSLYDRLKRMVIVCTGPDRTLDTQTNSFLDKADDSYILNINADDIIPQGDDMLLKLMPANH